MSTDESASTALRKMTPVLEKNIDMKNIVLPEGWSAHPSKKNPGHIYYFNKFTNETTWNREDVFSSKVSVMSMNADTIHNRGETMKRLGTVKQEETINEGRNLRKVVVKEENAEDNKLNLEEIRQQEEIARLERILQERNKEIERLQQSVTGDVPETCQGLNPDSVTVEAPVSTSGLMSGLRPRKRNHEAGGRRRRNGVLVVEGRDSKEGGDGRKRSCEAGSGLEVVVGQQRKGDEIIFSETEVKYSPLVKKERSRIDFGSRELDEKGKSETEVKYSPPIKKERPRINFDCRQLDGKDKSETEVKYSLPIKKARPRIMFDAEELPIEGSCDKKMVCRRETTPGSDSESRMKREIGLIGDSSDVTTVTFSEEEFIGKSSKNENLNISEEDNARDISVEIDSSVDDIYGIDESEMEQLQSLKSKYTDPEEEKVKQDKKKKEKAERLRRTKVLKEKIEEELLIDKVEEEILIDKKGEDILIDNIEEDILIDKIEEEEKDRKTISMTKTEDNSTVGSGISLDLSSVSLHIPEQNDRESSPSRSPVKVEGKVPLRILEEKEQSLQKKYGYTDSNYGLQYIKKDCDAKSSYKCKELDFAQRRTRKWAPPAEEFAGGTKRWGLGVGSVSSLPRERTPEHETGDISPVYGNLEESFEFLERMSSSSSRSNVSTGNVLDTSSASLEDVEEQLELPPVEISYECERPPSPEAVGLVEELQEEESLDWAAINLELIVEECFKFRSLVCKEEELEHVDVKEEERNDECIKDVATVLVVDTNVLLSSFPLVEDLSQDDGVTVYLPLQVLCELELHKEEGQNTRVRARAVVRWINSLRQRSRQKELWIQSSAQQKIAIKSHSSKECSGPEDKILATCLFLQKEDIQVYLLTDDNNLAKKAMENRVKKAGSSNIREVLTGQVEDTSELDTPSLTTDDAPGKDPEDLFVDTKSILRDVLETVLVKELQDVYGKDLWRKIPSVNPSPSPPYWSLDSLFQLYCGRQDSGMFDIIFPEYGHNLKDSVEKLKKSVKDDCSHASGLRALLTHVRILVDIVRSKGGNDDVVDITTEKLANIQSEVDNLVTSKIEEIVSDVPQEDQEGVQELFQTVWEIIASFTQGFASAFSVHFDFPPTKREIRFESKEEAGVKLPGFYTSVSDLWEAMTDLLVKEEKSLGKETQLLSSQLRLLHSRLVGFHSNVLGMEEREGKNMDTRINVRQLGLWVRNNNNCLRGGLEQLNTMRDTLMSCIYRQEEEDDIM